VHLPEVKLKKILLDSDVVNETDFISAQDEAKRLGQTTAEILISRGDVTEEFLLELLGSSFKLNLIDLKKNQPTAEAVESVSESFAKSHSLIIFENKSTLKVAMRDPLDLGIINFLEKKFSKPVEPYLTSSASLKFGLKHYKKEIGKEFNQIIQENLRKFNPINGDQEINEADLGKLAEALPVISILDNIIDHAVSLNASDIHFEPLPNSLLVRFRVDGVLEEILNLQKLIENVLVARVKVLANMQVDEHRTPQDGRFHFENSEGSMIDLRVNIIPIMHGEKVEMRLLKNSARPLTFEDLGMEAKSIKLVMDEIQKPHGMVLVTGPTGHGKTTTLYSILHILNTPKVNITTIEDPIEYEIMRVNQTQVNSKAGITFGSGLRALLRQNPDIIMVGEIRDNETVEIAVHAALTGHLVLSSLHTNDAASALPRLLDMGAPAFLLSSTVNVIIAQRLVRRICTSCINSFKITAEIKSLIAAQIKASGDKHIKSIPKSLYRGKGCNLCNHTGFLGQIGIYEVLPVSDNLREMILGSRTVGEIKKAAISEGLTTMFEDGLQKVEKGITTIDEVLRVVRE